MTITGEPHKNYIKNISYAFLKLNLTFFKHFCVNFNKKKIKISLKIKIKSRKKLRKLLLKKLLVIPI